MGAVVSLEQVSEQTGLGSLLIALLGWPVGLRVSARFKISTAECQIPVKMCFGKKKNQVTYHWQAAEMPPSLQPTTFTTDAKQENGDNSFQLQQI